MLQPQLIREITGPAHDWANNYFDPRTTDGYYSMNSFLENNYLYTFEHASMGVWSKILAAHFKVDPELQLRWYNVDDGEQVYSNMDCGPFQYVLGDGTVDGPIAAGIVVHKTPARTYYHAFIFEEASWFKCWR